MPKTEAYHLYERNVNCVVLLVARQLYLGGRPNTKRSSVTLICPAKQQGALCWRDDAIQMNAMLLYK